MQNYRNIIKKYAENKSPKVVCSDFDGTITIASKFPEIGDPNYLLIEKLRDLKSKGYKIIISSCRWSTAINPEKKANEEKKKVEDWLKENDVPYDELWHDNKPFASIYLDDRSINVKDLDEFDKRFEHIENYAKDQDFEYSCIMLDFDKKIKDEVIKWGKENIPDKWLYDGDGLDISKQRSENTHVTLCYGLIQEDLDKIKYFLSEQKEKGLIPVKAKLGEVSKFANDDVDVIKIEVISEDLNKLNKAIREKFINYSDFDTYEPHVTIAYCKPGVADSILSKKIFGNKEFSLDEFTFSIASQNKQIQFKLDGK